MRTRWLIILFLLVAVIGLGVLMFFASDRKSKIVAIASLDRAAVTHIEINRKQKNRLKFEKRNGHWWITEPLTAPAEESRIEQILSISSIPSHTRYSIANTDLARFGLSTPQATLLLDQTRIDFGDTDPIKQQRYTLVGHTLHLLEDLFIHLLVAPESDFLEKKLLPHHGEPVLLELPGIRLSKNKAGKWVSAQTGQRDYTGLVYAWRNASALSVMPLHEQISTTAETVRIEFRNASPLVYRILPRPEKLVLARPDLNLA
ncbi:MAG: DUF4340 domain-containing protein, partial [Pseudomonadota bacterium]